VIEPDLTGLAQVVGEQPYPVVFATVSGAHLYGFSSVDSDVDLRGSHVLPAGEVVGLRTGPETLTRTWTRGGVEIDLVTHDAAKFCRLLLRRNGYVLEQLLSPLVVATGAAHDAMKALAPGCLTRNHAHHYRGFARTQWDLFVRTGELKPLLYTFRVLLTGIHLMRTGEVEACLPRLVAVVPAPTYIAELVEAKRYGEHGRLAAASPGPATVADDVRALHAELDVAAAASSLPEVPTAESGLHDLLVDLRLSTA
jgi:predicted nucleotidyltransferase